MKRIWHKYTDWEDFKTGMWRQVNKQEGEEFFQAAIEFTGNAVLYGSWMLKVIVEWPIGCEHNLTDLDSNRKAWLGHAACSMAINCPEYITRAAWHHLTKKQQDEANQQAADAISIWEKTYEAKLADA